jgi:diguanylate cyclase (GGDEF)-like protein
VATHIPLISYVVWQVTIGAADWSVFLLLLGATLIGTIIALTGMAGLLQPIDLATNALSNLKDPRSFSRLPQAGPDLVGRLFAGVNRAADMLSAMVETLAEAARTDELTGLLNRRGLLEQANAATSDQGRIAVAIIDVDGFKKINDQLGHPGGDLIMRRLADALRTALPTSAVIGRWGGEEFVVTIPQQAERELLETIDRTRRGLADQPIALIEGHPVTFSGGVASTRLGERSIEAAIARADTALYAAKRAGRNRVILTANDQSDAAAGQGGDRT